MDGGPILVAGGGIGGLAAAVALRRRGLPVALVERSRSLGEIGAGIQLGPNAFRCLRALDVPLPRGAAVPMEALVLMDAVTAREIARIDTRGFPDAFGHPYAVVHRADLHRALLDAATAADVAVLTDHAATGYAVEGGGAGVRLHLDGRPAMEGRALVAADGLRSPLRAAMLGDGPPRVSGHATYRAVIAADRMPADLRVDRATLWAGPRCHVVHYPLRDRSAYNLVVTVHRAMEEAVAGHPVGADEVAEGFAHAHPAVRRIVGLGADWRLWVLCDRPPAPRWTDGPVALLGDAAHPMLQYMAQGACMAMEDAVALARHWDARDVPGGLRRYAGARMRRTARLQRLSRWMGDRVYHPRGEAARRRDAAWGAVRDWPARLGWLYGAAA